MVQYVWTVCPQCSRPLKARIKLGGNMLIPHHKPPAGSKGHVYTTGWCAAGATEFEAPK